MSKITGSGGSKLRNSKLIILAIIILAIVVFAGSLFILKNAFSEETFYVLAGAEEGTTYPTKTLITPDMLTPRITSEGGSPNNAMSIEDIQRGEYYTKFTLKAGDVLSASNTTGKLGGALEWASDGIPEDWVITQFSVSADNAVGGRIRKGDYFDLMVATPEKAFYPFINVLVLDATISLEQATSSDAADTTEAYAGQTSQYVVAMAPAEAAELQQIMKLYPDDVKMVMSPVANDKESPNLSDYSGIFTFDGTTKSMSDEIVREEPEEAVNEEPAGEIGPNAQQPSDEQPSNEDENAEPESEETQS